jgi:glycosyltransferase involved in cell wall biosynthesis
MRPDRVLAVVPALNEEKHIMEVLKPLLEAKQQGLVDDALVIDDGSKDKTKEICESLGVRVIRHEENMGKGSALLTALEVAGQEDFSIIFMTDADMVDLTVQQISGFIEKIKDRNQIYMIRAPYRQVNNEIPEGSHTCTHDNSGFRAIRLSKLILTKKLVEALTSGKFTLEDAIEEHFRPPSVMEFDKWLIDDPERLSRGLRSIGVQVKGNLTLETGNDDPNMFLMRNSGGDRYNICYNKDSWNVTVAVNGLQVDTPPLRGKMVYSPNSTTLYVFNQSDYDEYKEHVLAVGGLGLKSRRRGGGHFDQVGILLEMAELSDYKLRRRERLAKLRLIRSCGLAESAGDARELARLDLDDIERMARGKDKNRLK